MLSLLRLSVAVSAALLFAAERVDALDIQFDYTYDATGFFTAHPDRINLLEQAAAVFESHLADALTAITPSGGNTWVASFPNPSTGSTVTVNDLTIQTGVVVVYVGARVLGGSTLGFGGPGSYSASGFTQDWLDTVAARGQAGALTGTKTDFGPWGGAVTFASDATWYFGTGSLTGANDFLSVATHELGHLFGLGTAPSWNALISGSKFTGANATAANGGIQASLSGTGHWAEGTQSKVFGTLITQEAAMDPSITVGTQKFFTNLDFAGMRDIGWQVVPEPSSTALLFAAIGGLALVPRRRSRVARA